MLRKTPLKRSGKLRPMSKKRQRESRTYSLLRAAFLEAKPKCEACAPITGYACVAGNGSNLMANRSRDVHHVKGRLGGNLNNPDTWLAVCRTCHNWIHNHPRDARALGLLA